MPVITPREFHPRKTLFVASVLAVFIIATLVRQRSSRPELDTDLLRWSGRTMGTYYTLSVARWDISADQWGEIQHQVGDYLDSINRQMSTYIPDSEISRFNRSESTDPFPVSADFLNVTRRALYWAEQTGGAFDPTLGPLVAVWGFGPEEVEVPPSPTRIEQAKVITGYENIQVLEEIGAIRKSDRQVQLDLNAIAKGYAVDGVAALLLSAGAENVFVEIGGDVVAFGTNAAGIPWRIGVELPVPESQPGDILHGITHIRHGALAGSGEYRQLVELDDGSLISHIIDPRTGSPVQHSLMAVNVWSETCADADAVATALIIMGYEEGLRWIEQQTGVEAIFFVRSDSDDIDAFTSSGFVDITHYTPL